MLLKSVMENFNIKMTLRNSIENGIGYSIRKMVLRNVVEKCH
jgi:hypothetical protein